QEYPAILDSIRLKIYPDSALINREISRGFAQYNILFSEQIKPKIFYFFISPNGRNPASCFQFGIKDTFGVNLFGYLGRDFVFYPHLYPGVSYTYLWREHDYIAKNIMELLYEDFLTAQKIETAEITLINNMVLEAKRVYFLSQVLPEVPLEILFGYPKEKLTWCDDHINLIWTFLIENKLLQSSDPQAIKRYAHPGPSTPAISPESPGAVGVYIGYQIIKKFQQKNPSLSLPEILKTKSEEIIRHAQYKP
nr:hypothetical protein [Chitinophagales bacterium]